LILFVEIDNSTLIECFFRGQVRASALYAIASFLGAWSRAAVAPLLPTSVLGPVPSSGGAVLSFLTSGSVAGSMQPKQAPAAASSTYSSGELLAERERDARRSVQMQLTRSAMRLAADASVLVRRELVISLSQLVSAHRDEFVKLAAEKADEEAAVGVIAPANSAHTGHQRSASANQISTMSMTSPLLGPSSLAAPALPPIGEAVDVDGKDDSGRDERDVRDSSVRVKVWRVLQVRNTCFSFDFFLIMFIHVHLCAVDVPRSMSGRGAYGAARDCVSHLRHSGVSCRGRRCGGSGRRQRSCTECSIDIHSAAARLAGWWSSSHPRGHPVRSEKSAVHGFETRQRFVAIRVSFSFLFSLRSFLSPIIFCGNSAHCAADAVIQSSQSDCRDATTRCRSCIVVSTARPWC
jgi:hypothetical protein